jgi:hypothetical protein
MLNMVYTIHQAVITFASLLVGATGSFIPK